MCKKTRDQIRVLVIENKNTGLPLDAEVRLVCNIQHWLLNTLTNEFRRVTGHPNMRVKGIKPVFEA